MAEAILTINAGSSSIKFALFNVKSGLNSTVEGEAEGIGTAPHLVIKENGVVVLDKTWPAGDSLGYEPLLNEILSWIEANLGDAQLIAAGHRIVHGGQDFYEPLRLNEDRLKDLEALDILAPLHEPHNIAAIRAVFNIRPHLPQVGCFDTAFHHSMLDIAKLIGIPRKFHAQGVRRYGFHGLSYEYISTRLAEVAPKLAQGRVIVAHLGNGASMCAIKAGKSLDSTMGFTALDGLMMGTRTGSIDAGVVLYMIQSAGMDEKALTDLLYKQSGLLGVSGISSDVRTLLESPKPEAKEALELFCFKAARQAAGLVNTLQGLDGLVFTAGIGEHAAPVRAAICAHLSWMGIKISAAANTANEDIISTPDSAVEVRVIPTNEELMIARHTLNLVKGDTKT